MGGGSTNRYAHVDRKGMSSRILRIVRVPDIVMTRAGQISDQLSILRILQNDVSTSV